MAGISISVCFVDDEIEPLFSMPSSSPFWSIQ
jgi:dihydroxyacetone kinase/dihydroxyacetone kinase-like protein